MARINRSDQIQRAVNDLGISAASEKIPNETLDKVQLTYDLSQILPNKVATAASSVSSGSGTAFTASSTADTYITGIALSIVKDSTCDMATGVIAIRATIDGTLKNILSLALLTLTAQNQTAVMTFPNPLKVSRGGTVGYLAPTFTVGTASFSVNVNYFQTSSN